MRYIVDRFEGAFAVVELEDKKMINIPKVALPVETKEGDIIVIQIDSTQTENRRKTIDDKMQMLFKKSE